jgi:hypothetical protein
VNHDYPTPDDYAVANVGQLKQMATKAAAELNANLPGGATTGTAAGAAVNALIAQWNTAPASNVVRDDYAVLTLGQLKAVAQVFYDQLIAVGYTNAYPWGNGAAGRLRGGEPRAVEVCVQFRCHLFHAQRRPARLVGALLQLGECHRP